MLNYRVWLSGLSKFHLYGSTLQRVETSINVAQLSEESKGPSTWPYTFEGLVKHVISILHYSMGYMISSIHPF